MDANVRRVDAAEICLDASVRRMDANVQKVDGRERIADVAGSMADAGGAAGTANSCGGRRGSRIRGLFASAAGARADGWRSASAAACCLRRSRDAREARAAGGLRMGAYPTTPRAAFLEWCQAPKTGLGL